MGETRRVRFVDSHTGGEPTRVILEGGPELQGASMADRRQDFSERFDGFRSSVVNEPRGSDVLVGALLTPPVTEGALAGVIFFNNVDMLGMCGHGTMGLVETLRYLGRIEPGEVRFDTAVGPVKATLHESGEVSFENVPAYRFAKEVAVTLEDGTRVMGDVAWGGNWFYLCQDHGQELAYQRVVELTDFSWRVRRALEQAGITGANGGIIDHIELLGPPQLQGAHAKNFVLCPGGAYDRSPCGTGTSAKLACLAADGKLREDEEFVIESITGSTFRGSFRTLEDSLIPTVTGRAWVMAEGELLFEDADPLTEGLPTPGPGCGAG